MTRNPGNKFITPASFIKLLNYIFYNYFREFLNKPLYYTSISNNTNTHKRRNQATNTYDIRNTFAK